MCFEYTFFSVVNRVSGIVKQKNGAEDFSRRKLYSAHNIKKTFLLAITLLKKIILRLFFMPFKSRYNVTAAATATKTLKCLLISIGEIGKKKKKTNKKMNKVKKQ